MAMLTIGGSFPVQGQLPISTEVEVEGVFPTKVKLIVEGTLFVRGVIPLNCTLPVNGNVPIDGHVRIAGETNYEGYMPVHGNIPIQGEIPIMLNVPIDTQCQTRCETVCETKCCATASTCLPGEQIQAAEEAVTVKRVVRKLQPGEQLQGTSSLPAAAQQAPLEPIISPSSSVHTSVQRFMRPLSQSASVTQQP